MDLQDLKNIIREGITTPLDNIEISIRSLKPKNKPDYYMLFIYIVYGFALLYLLLQFYNLFAPYFYLTINV
jgi:hypothetical protein